MEDDPDLNLGPQPLDALMDELGLNNHAVVAASAEQITHKMVSKGRKGRRLKRKVQLKLLRAFNAAAPGERTFELAELFNSVGRL